LILIELVDEGRGAKSGLRNMLEFSPNEAPAAFFRVVLAPIEAKQLAQQINLIRI